MVLATTTADGTFVSTDLAVVLKLFGPVIVPELYLGPLSFAALNHCWSLTL